MLSSADHKSRSAKNEVDPKQWSELYGHPVELMIINKSLITKHYVLE